MPFRSKNGHQTNEYAYSKLISRCRPPNPVGLGSVIASLQFHHLSPPDPGDDKFIFNLEAAGDRSSLFPSHKDGFLGRQD